MKLRSWIVVFTTLAVIGFVVYRSFRREIRTRARHAVELATGDAAGCSIREVFSPLDLELDEATGEERSTLSTIEEKDGLRLVRSGKGEFWTPRGTDLAFLLAEQRLDLYSAADPARGIQTGDVVIDCGANIGTFTRKALDLGAGRVVAIEISPRNIQCLRSTFAREIEEGRVEIVPLGVWNEQSSMELAVYDNSALDSLVMQSRVEENAKPVMVTVELTTLDKIVADLGLSDVDFIKMDIEGAERNALEGAKETIQKFRPRLAIAAENLEDDLTVLPDLIRRMQPDYEIAYGRCRVIRPKVVRPEVMSFF